MGGNIGVGIPLIPDNNPGTGRGMGMPGIPREGIPMLGMVDMPGSPGRGGKEDGPEVEGGGLIGWNEDSDDGPEAAPLASTRP